MLRKALIGLIALWALSAPAFGQGNQPIQTQASVPITISTATTTRLITGVANKQILVTAVDVIASGSGSIQFISGTGATCGSGTTNVTGNYTFTAQVGFTKGTGVGALWVLPVGDSLCAVTDQAVGMPGSIAYGLF